MGCGGGCANACGGPEVPGCVVTELVLADEGEARAVALRRGGARPRVDAKGADQVKLAALWALLAGGEYADELVHAFTPLHEEGEAGPWVFRVPAPLVALLAAVDDGGAARAAAAWVESDALALDAWEAGPAAAFVGDLAALARDAAAAGKGLLMRVSL